MSRGPVDILLRELAERSSHDSRAHLVRLAVRLRAQDACEYCLLPTAGQFHLDHVIPPSLWPSYAEGGIDAVPYVPGRQGPRHLDNLAWCCAPCNTAKGQRVVGRMGRMTVRLFDPRYDRWAQHFAFAHRYLLIIGVSPIGRVTAQTLGFNDSRLGGPLGTRHDMIVDGRYPPHWTLP